MNDKQFVSRGGEKLQAAIRNWKLEIRNLTILDVGSSTGGFVDCLLQNGAAKVFAVDTAYGELAWKLRKDPRVVVMERTNILHLEVLPSPSVIPAKAGIQLSEELNPTANLLLDPPLQGDDSMPKEETQQVDLITIDAGWTKLERVLPVVRKFLKPGGQIVALLKPHYETDQKNLRKGVVPKEMVEEIKEKVLGNLEGLGFRVEGEMESPILGGGGNKEYLVLLEPE